MGYGKARIWQDQDVAQKGHGTAGMWHSPAGARPLSQCDREHAQHPPRHHTTFTNPLQWDFPSSHSFALPPNPWE